jgi:hypothetical protein
VLRQLATEIEGRRAGPTDPGGGGPAPSA